MSISAGIVSADKKESLTIGENKFDGTPYSILSAALASENTVAVDTGIYDDGTRLELSGKTICGAADVVFTGNTLSIDKAKGGVFYFNGGTNTLTGMTFSGNIYNASSTAGGGGAVASDSTLVVEGTYFNGNTSTNLGGAIYASSGKLILNNARFENNTARSGGAVLAGGITTVNGGYFGKNKAKSGSAFYVHQANLTVTGNAVFEENGDGGTYNGAVVHGNGSSIITIDGAIFRKNKGYAVLLDNITIDSTHFIHNAEFSGNKNAAIYVNGNINNNLTLYIGNLEFDGNNVAVRSRQNVVIDGLLTLKQSTDTITLFAKNDVYPTISIAANKFLSESAGLAKVVDAHFTSEWLIDGTFAEMDGFTTFRHLNDQYIAKADAQIVDTGAAILLDDADNGNSGCLMSGGTYFLGQTYDSLGAAVSAGASKIFVSGADDSFTVIDVVDTGAAVVVPGSVNGEKGYLLAGTTCYYGTAYDSLDSAVAAAKSKVFVEKYSGKYTLVNPVHIQGVGGDGFVGDGTIVDEGGAIDNNSRNLRLTGVTFSNYKTNKNGGALYIHGSGEIVIADSCFSGNTAQSNRGGAIYNYGQMVTVKNTDFINSYARVGGAIGGYGTTKIYGGTFSGNTTGTQYGSAIIFDAVNSLIDKYDGKGTIFHDNEGGAAVFVNRQCIKINGATFSGNRNNISGAAFKADYASTGVNEFTDVLFDGNVGSSGGAIYLVGTTAVVSGSTFATSTDSILLGYSDSSANKYSSLTFKDKNYLNASINTNGKGGYCFVDNAEMIFGNTIEINLAGMTFSGTNSLTFNGAQVNFTVTGDQAQDLNGAAITVDGSLWQNENLTIATGIKDIGTVTVTNNADNKLEAVLVGTDLVLKAKATISDGAVIEQNFINNTNSSLITGGEINAVFVGTDLTSGNVDTEVQGGKFSKFFVGGALVKNDSAEMGTVTVNVSGGEFADRIYGAGYAYGIGDVDADTVATELHVAKS
ncbi:MAG: hypothetical protein IKA71_07140, partial [Lentisphaeria bacterium]|nr:hypothetical protein [Lentisphaeria bacterium]